MDMRATNSTGDEDIENGQNELGKQFTCQTCMALFIRAITTKKFILPIAKSKNKQRL